MTVDPGLVSRLLGAVGRRRDELVELTQALVRERSLLGEEASAQDLMAERIAALGFSVEHVDVAAHLDADDATTGIPLLPYDGRTCVAGRIVGSGGGRSLHLSGHVDVVPAEAPELWSRDPWGGELADGRIWGRGAGDMKGGVAAYLIGAAAFLEVCGQPAGDLLFSTVIEEECTGNGMQAVLAAGYDADATLIGEPSGLALQHAGVGVIWARLTAVSGGAHIAHSTGSASWLRLHQAIDALRELERRLNADPTAPQERVFFDAFEQPYRLNVGVLAGGEWPSSEPAQASARVRLGLGPRTTPAQVQELLRAAVHEAAPEVEVTFEGFRAHAYCDDLDHDLARTLTGAHRELHGELPGRRVLAGTTDARHLTAPALCYGPVAGAIHGTDEWVDVASTVRVAEAIALTIAGWQE
ncbi:MAG TPA: M20/M25/M40 family metallo-hydrolase [Conexibacter sp.]|jgi:acetylornithine deacetylase|nr:M20/M25/M40 family metallo-hydrolase [Conexibacter sp.]